MQHPSQADVICTRAMCCSYTGGGHVRRGSRDLVPARDTKILTCTRSWSQLLREIMVVNEKFCDAGWTAMT